MSEFTEALRASVAAACAKHSGTDDVAGCADGGWNPALWAALEQIGVTTLSVTEASGGSGGNLADLVTVLEVLGEHAAGVPLAETALLAGWLLASSGAAVPDGPMTATVAGPTVRMSVHNAGVKIVGSVVGVPWARCADHVVVLDGERVIVLARGEYTVRTRTNLAGEPRDDIQIDATVPAARVHPLPEDGSISAEAFGQRAALGRAALIAGAGRRALELTVAYASEREQFGRPIAAFQAVQQHIAAMAGEVLLCRVTVEAAAVAVDAGLEFEVAVASAKVISGQAASLVSSLAHQVHGAIGFTEEHALRHSTTRMWAWRDEVGNEDEWADRLGQAALSVGTAGLWPLITATAAVSPNDHRHALAGEPERSKP